MSETTDRASERLEYWYSFKHAVISQLQSEFRKSGRTYADLATALGWTPQQVEDRIRARCRVKTKWMYEIAWELGLYIRPVIEPQSELGAHLDAINHPLQAETKP